MEIGPRKQSKDFTNTIHHPYTVIHVMRLINVVLKDIPALLATCWATPDVYKHHIRSVRSRIYNNSWLDVCKIFLYLVIAFLYKCNIIMD